MKGARVSVHEVTLHSESNRQQQTAEQAKEPDMHGCLQDSRMAGRDSALGRSVWQWKGKGSGEEKTESQQDVNPHDGFPAYFSNMFHNLPWC